MNDGLRRLANWQVLPTVVPGDDHAGNFTWREIGAGTASKSQHGNEFSGSEFQVRIGDIIHTSDRCDMTLDMDEPA